LIDRFTPVPEWIHLDIADGKFTPHKTWNEPSSWAKLRAKQKLEVHLMAEEPEKLAASWLAAGAQRIIVHYEALFDQRYRQHKPETDPFLAVANMCKERGAELVLAVNPETPAGALLSRGKDVAGFQTLAVHPGLSGQQFLPVVLEKISFLRAHFPNAIIEVDGGVNPEVIARAAAAGANVFTTESYVFHSADPLSAYAELASL
jgi:ribulose-phosphate 3-epimerase